MKIALIYLGRRGAGLPISLELARGLATSDEMLIVLSRTAAGAADWEKLGAEILTTDTYENLLQAVFSWIYQKRIHRLADQISTWKPDVLLFPMFYTWNPFLQARLSYIPSVIAVHDPRPHPGLKDKLFQWLEDRSIRQAARCIVFSQSLAPELTRRGVSIDKIDAISLGAFDYAHIGNVPAQPSQVRQSTPTLLFFGRITAYKGLDILLQAYLQIRRYHRARLVIAGDGDLRHYRSLLKAAVDIEIINRWISEEEIPMIFRQSDIVVLPYTSASQSGVIPIAASFALPVIATRTGGIPEQIQDGSNGLLVEPGSTQQLVAAIEHLLTEPAFGIRLGLTLRHDFQNKYNWQQTASHVRASLDKARMT